MKRENSIVVWLPCKEMMCLTPSVVESCQGKSSKKSLTSWKSTHITQTSLPHQCLTLSDVFEPRLSLPLPRLQNWKSKSNCSTTHRFWCVQNKMDIDNCNDVNNVLLIPKFSARFLSGTKLELDIDIDNIVYNLLRWYINTQTWFSRWTLLHHR